MDLTIIADLLSSINPIVLGGVAGGFLVAGGAGLYIKRNKTKFIENADAFAQSNDFKTLKTEDLEREFGSLTVQTKMLDEDESLFFDKSAKDKLSENELTQPSTKLVDEASVFDSFGKQDQALESLKKAVDIEKHDKERVRLKILLSQYNIKKGKVSLDNIIKEYPSFHAKVSFGPDNTLSALMGSAIPKTDSEIQNSVHKTIDKEFDIFADLPVLNEKAKVTEQHVVYVSQQQNLFDDLPTIEQVSQSTIPDTESIFKSELSPVLESQSESTIEQSTQMSLFDDISPLNNKEHFNQEPKNQLLESTTNLSNYSDPSPVDQFSWNSNSSLESETEKMLQELQKQSDKVDKINETEAMDDMQKFWQEFGSMVVDIKKDVADNHISTKKTSSLENSIPFMTTDTFNNKISIIEKEDIQTANEKEDIQTTHEKEVIPDLIPILKEKIENTEPTTQVAIKENIVNNDLEPPVLNEIINSPIVTSTNYSVASTTPILSAQNPVPVIKESPVVEQSSIVTPNEDSITQVAPNVTPAIVQQPDVTPVKPQTCKVWANWIVNIEGQQVFRNHFINLKNTWGSVQAGEELYGGINRLSGKNPDGKNYPWVLVSVFPLHKE